MGLSHQLQTLGQLKVSTKLAQGPADPSQQDKSWALNKVLSQLFLKKGWGKKNKKRKKKKGVT